MNAETVVAPLRKSVRGLLSHADLGNADRVLLATIDGKAARLVTGYAGALDDPAAMIGLAQEMDRLYAEVATITAQHHRS